MLTCWFFGILDNTIIRMFIPVTVKSTICRYRRSNNRHWYLPQHILMIAEDFIMWLPCPWIFFEGFFPLFFICIIFLFGNVINIYIYIYIYIDTKGHQGDVIHVQKGQIQKHYAPKLSSIVLSTKPKNSSFCYHCARHSNYATTSKSRSYNLEMTKLYSQNYVDFFPFK